MWKQQNKGAVAYVTRKATNIRLSWLGIPTAGDRKAKPNKQKPTFSW